MEQRTLKIGDRTIRCYEDGSVEYNKNKKGRLVRTFGVSNSGGYKTITIAIEGSKKTISVHRLIAMAFHSNIDNLPEVDHIDRNRSNNRPCNLRWVDRKVNMANTEDVDYSTKKFGVRCCEDRKAYSKARAKDILHIRKPDGVQATTGVLSPEVYNMLRPLSQRDRYFKYQELRGKND